jgi:iron only hydrogenase large subunit-like protein
MGAVIKRFWAARMGIDPAKVFSVSIMPCTAKKFEADRPEMADGGLADVDAVLTTRELAQLIRQSGLDLTVVQPDTADTPFGETSTAGKIFGATGGVMEAAVRTAHFMLTGKELDDLAIPALRGLEGRKEATVRIGPAEVGVAVVSGLGNARELLNELRDGRNDLHFIEVMGCPGGCISGGGQPIDLDLSAVKSRMQALYNLDAEGELRTSHTNASVMRLCEEFLGEPLGHKSHELLHTHYAPREEVVR